MATIEIKHIGHITFVAFKEERITGKDSIDSMEEKLSKLVDEFYRTKILIDFSGVTFFSSEEFLPKIISLHRKLKEAKGMLILCNISPKTQISEVLKTTHLDQYFTIVKDVEEAFSLFPTSEKP